MTDEQLPEAAKLIKDLVNTLDVLSDEDALAGGPETTAWLAERAVIGSTTVLSDRDAATIREVREALRDILLGHNDEPVPPHAVETLNRAAERSRLCLKFSAEGSVLVCETGGADAAVGRIMAAIHTAMADDSWKRLKACRRHDCRWVFYDQSRNASKTWCSMGVCGNRTKAEKYRKRHSGAATA